MVHLHVHAYFFKESFKGILVPKEIRTFREKLPKAGAGSRGTPPPVPAPAFLLSRPLLLCGVSSFPLSSHSFQLAPCASLRAVDAYALGLQETKYCS